MKARLKLFEDFVLFFTELICDITCVLFESIESIHVHNKKYEKIEVIR